MRQDIRLATRLGKHPPLRDGPVIKGPDRPRQVDISLTTYFPSIATVSRIHVSCVPRVGDRWPWRIDGWGYNVFARREPTGTMDGEESTASCLPFAALVYIVQC